MGMGVGSVSSAALPKRDVSAWGADGGEYPDDGTESTTSTRSGEEAAEEAHDEGHEEGVCDEGDDTDATDTEGEELPTLT
jgi:hypothetical protein